MAFVSCKSLRGAIARQALASWLRPRTTVARGWISQRLGMGDQSRVSQAVRRDRGDRREAIFRDDEDRRQFLTTVGQACRKTGWLVHALGLMPDQRRPRQAGDGGGLASGDNGDGPLDRGATASGQPRLCQSPAPPAKTAENFLICKNQELTRF
jgi:hypothetical protein